MPFHAMHHGSQDASLLRHKKEKSIRGPVCSTLLFWSAVLGYGASLASSPSLSALSTPPLFHLIALSDWFRFNACIEQTGQLWVKQIVFKWANPIQTQSSWDLLLRSVFRNLIESALVPWLALFLLVEDYKRQTMFSSRDINFGICRHYRKCTLRMGGRDSCTGSEDDTAADMAPWFTNIVCLPGRRCNFTPTKSCHTTYECRIKAICA